MRVSVQLIDADSGNHLWAERFDKPLADLFDMQDEIVSRLAGAINTELAAAEARRAERAPNPDATDLIFQGAAWMHKGFSAAYLTEARRLFDRALALDPANVFGLVWVAGVDITQAITFYPEDRAARLAAAEEALTKALSLAPEYAPAHLLFGILQIHTNRASLGVRQCERALELDRNLAHAHAQIGTGKLFLGQAEETEAHVQKALRLSPHDQFVYVWCTIAGMAKLLLGKEEEAVDWLRRSIETNRNHPLSHFCLAAALARLGRLPEARSEVQSGLAMNPTFTIARLRASAPLARMTGGERLVDDLRKAGVPEQ
jgi:tetratricopeptide (TPR) repeat protein